MSAQKIIDLDKIVVGTFSVRLAGQDYVLPRAVKLSTAFGMMRLFEELQKDGEDSKASPNQIESLFDFIAVLFTEKYPEMTSTALKDLLSFQQGNYLLKEIVSEIFAQEEDAGNP